MKIIHLIESLTFGGKERQLIETLKFLSTQNGIECELVLMSDVCDFKDFDCLDIVTHKIIRNYKKDPSIFYIFLKLFKQTKPQVIHSWGSMCSVYALPAAKVLGIKFVNNFLQDAPYNFSVKNKEFIRAKLTFPFSDIIAANSYAGLKAYGVPYSKSACLHNGFDFSRTLGLDIKEVVRKKFKITSEFVIGMVANFSENKDYSTFINAAQILLKKRNDLTFMAIGDGKYYKTSIKLIKPEFQNKIKMIGKQNRVLNILNIFDIGILSTNTRAHCEGIPNAVMEYMALKKPVIVTDCGGNSELVDDNFTGFLVKAFNSDHLCEKIEILLENRTMAEKFGRNGFNKLKNEFRLEVMGKKFLNLYSDIISKI